MKRFLSKSAAESLTQHARGDIQQSAAKKARNTSPERQHAAGSTEQGRQTKQQQQQQQAVPRNSTSSPATSLMQNGWTDLGQQARVGYWPRKLSGVSQAAMQALLGGIQWQQVGWCSYQCRYCVVPLHRSEPCCASPPLGLSCAALSSTDW